MKIPRMAPAATALLAASMLGGWTLFGPAYYELTTLQPLSPPREGVQIPMSYGTYLCTNSHSKTFAATYKIEEIKRPDGTFEYQYIEQGRVPKLVATVTYAPLGGDLYLEIEGPGISRIETTLRIVKVSREMVMYLNRDVGTLRKAARNHDVKVEYNKRKATALLTSERAAVLSLIDELARTAGTSQAGKICVTRLTVQ